MSKWFHYLAWRMHRVLTAAWTVRDSYYFVVDGALYVMHTNGSDKPYEWTWTLVMHQ